MKAKTMKGVNHHRHPRQGPRETAQNARFGGVGMENVGAVAAKGSPQDEKSGQVPPRSNRVDQGSKEAQRDGRVPFRLGVPKSAAAGPELRREPGAIQVAN